MLYFCIYGGILVWWDLFSDQVDLEVNDICLLDLVVVNFYFFE